MLKKISNNHLIMSGIYKGISGISLFVSIRLLLDYLGAENYGLWVLVFTLFQLVLLMDFGVQSSLKTKIKSKEDTIKEVIHHKNAAKRKTEAELLVSELLKELEYF